MQLNDTHDPARESWVAVAKDPANDFPIQNLPLGVFLGKDGNPRGGIAIGDQILDLSGAVAAGLFSGDAEQAARAAMGSALNPLMALGNEAASTLRAAVADLLDAGNTNHAAVEGCLVAIASVEMVLPGRIGSFTDFLCSYDHTRRMSPDGTLPPAFTSLPIAYHGRATSVRASGVPLVRPNGHYLTADGTLAFGPEPSQDFELEMGIFVGLGNDLGRPISLSDAPDRLFGYCLLNDWSARCIQFWESRPLGPFLGKSMMTTISPWVVTAEALAPFAAPARLRDPGDEAPPHLDDATNRAHGGLDIELFADWTTARMRRDNRPPKTVTATNFRDCYWTAAQMLTHHASNGCNLEPGDLFGSGTLSGPTDQSRACLAELNDKGTTTLNVGGEPRIWIGDGDEINFHGRASREGFASIGFGDCRGQLIPSVPWPNF